MLSAVLEVLQTIAVGSVWVIIPILAGLATWHFLAFLEQRFPGHLRQTIIAVVFLVGFLFLSYLFGQGVRAA